MKNIRNFVVLFSILAAAATANAQTTLHGKFQLTSQVRWGNAVLPTGQYRFSMDSIQSPLIIQSEDGKTSTMAVAKTSVDAAPGGSYILTTGSGADRTVRSINLPQLGLSLTYKPLTSEEREMLYTSASQTVPVQMAKR